MINTINNKVFRNANEAYEYVHDQILQHGVSFGDTKALFNVGFYITNPADRKIINKERKWNEEYAEAEWEWYLTGDPSIRHWEIYMVRFLRYGNVWLMNEVRLILTMVTNGNVMINSKELLHF